MSKPFSLAALIPPFLAGLLIAGLPWWTAPYNRFHLLRPLPLAACAGFLLLALFLGYVQRPLWILRVLALAGGVPAAVLARVVVDTMKDPTSHNLWPFEVVLAGILAVALAVPGALLGWGLGWLARRGNAT